MQQHLPQITEQGASLVAISPQIPAESLRIAEKDHLSFLVLSDVGSGVARSFGLVFTLSEHLRPLFEGLGIDLVKSNGTDTFELPVPATFVLDPNGIVRASYVNADYKQRMEPSQIIKALKEVN